MDKVWSWDHCFNAIALAEGQPGLALDQFLTPFDHQDASGALPDSVTQSEVLYNYVKPPIHGWAFQAMRGLLPDPLTSTELSDVYQRLSSWTRFWLDSRRVPGRALPHYQHGNDSGWDNATTFDPGRVVETSDLAAFLIFQTRVLADLATELGASDQSEVWRATAAEMQEALFTELWVDDHFRTHGLTSRREWSSRSLLDLMAISLGSDLPPQVVDALAISIEAHLTDWGLATEPPDSSAYEADGYWRGPIWAPSTMLVEDGLRRAGQVKLADEISRRFLRLCEQSGFAENFDALTGEGLRDHAYTWTAATYLIFARALIHRGGPTPTVD